MKTINLTGIGPLEIKTELKEVQLAGALTIDGTPANCKKKKVSSAKKWVKAAIESDAAGYWLKHIKNDVFMLMQPEEN